MEEIKVIVVKYADRDNLLLRYTDPMSGRRITKSAGTNNKREAERNAAKWEAELREGRYHAPSKTTWEAFREKYESEVLTGLAANTERKVACVFNAVEENLNPKLLREMTAGRISYLQAELRKNDCSEDTIKGYMAHLKAALRKAADWGMITTAPKIVMPKRATGAGKAKGRPITGEEFDRLIAAIPKLLTIKRKCKGGEFAPVAPSDDAIKAWEFYLTGLWLSGLRLAESLELYWDRDDKLQVDLSGKYPVLRIPAALEKGNTDRELPMAPEFAELLLSVPESDRSGQIFILPKIVGNGPMSADAAGRAITALGKLAGVVVKRTATADPEKPSIKYASAHDLRRSFGDRWAMRVLPQVLQDLMRHESIETSLTYYRSKDAQATAAILWNARESKGNNQGNTDQNAKNSESVKSS